MCLHNYTLFLILSIINTNGFERLAQHGFHSIWMQLNWIQYFIMISHHAYIQKLTNNFPHSWLTTGFVIIVTRRMPFMGARNVYPSTVPKFTPDVWWGSCCSIFSFLCNFFSLFLLAIVLPVLLRFTDSDYPFGIFKLFLTSAYG